MLDLKKYLILLENSASHGLEIDNMMTLVHWFMLLLFIGWGVFFIYTLFKFNSYSNPKANYHGTKSHISSYTEVGIIIFECVLIIGFAIPLWASLKTNVPEKADLEIRVVAQQFKWNIHYPGLDGVFGKTDPKLINDSQGNFIGLDRNSVGGKDDIMLQDDLHLPVNKLVKIRLTSRDVIHSFSLPEMRVKQDAIPGMEIPIFFTPTMTSREFLKKIKISDPDRYNGYFEFNKDDKSRKGFDALSEEYKNKYRGYQIACAQLCGNSHYKMRGIFTVESDTEFSNWISSKSALLIEDDEDDDEW